MEPFDNRAPTAAGVPPGWFRDVFEEAVVGVAITGLDGGWVAVNPAFCRTLGYTREQLLALTPADLAIPDDHGADMAQRAQLIAGHVDGYRRVARYRHADGYSLAVSVSVSALRGAGGATEAILTQIQDVTAQQRTARAVRDAEARYRTLLEQLPAMVYTAQLDSVSSTTYVSPQVEQIFGYTPEEWLADPELWLRLLHPDDRARVLGETLRLQRTPQAHSMEYRAYTRDGRLIWLYDLTQLVRDSDGRPLYLQGIVSDITAQKQAEEAARASEERFRRAFELGLVGMAITSPDRESNLVNDEICAMLGYAREELLDRDWVTITHPDDVPEDMAMQARVLAGEIDGYRIEKRYVRGDGQICHAVVATRCVRRPDGAPDYFVSLIQDATQRVRAEEARSRSEAELRTLLECAPDTILTVDRELRVQFINRASTGAGAEQVAGYRLIQRVAPEHRGAVERAVARVFETGQSASCEFQALRADGGAAWYDARIARMHAGAEPERVLLIMHDISERREARQALLELNQTLEARVRQRTAEVQDLYDRAPAGYHSLDSEGRYIQVNETELGWLGYAREEVVGRRFSEFMTPDSQRVFAAHFPAFKQRGEIRDMEHDLVRRDGSTFPILLSATAVYDEAGAFAMSRATLIDITDRRAAEMVLRRANAELAQAARAKDEFLSTMSHELRTPLHGILALSEMLIEQTRGPLNERQLRSVRGIEESGRHLLALINDILDLSKIDADRLELQADDVAVAEVCAVSMALVQELALRKGLALSFETPDVLATVRGDPRRLKQMLVNLLSNAVKFTPSGGRVSLAARAADGRVELAVRDTGIGIAADDLPRLFHPFVQLDSSLARQYEGTGLGLALVRRLAELHGGSVAVESEPGAGSTFTLSLPASRLPGARPALQDGAAPRAPRPDSPDDRAARGTVLVADDSRLNRDTVGDYLAGRGYAVVFAASGEEAVAVALVELPDVILMDIQMPGVDGLTATSQLRAMELFAKTPIVALTALAMPGDRERCLAAGASEYLTKPVSLRGLTETIQRLMRA